MALLLSKQRKHVLLKLQAGWYLDANGLNLTGGWCWTEGRKGFRVSTSDMNFLYSNMLIEHEQTICDYKISVEGVKTLLGEK